ncbi:MAG TPA: hypothetical protein VGX37_05890 [Allosphingosinicella sp.]|nr:hypothetical protein [Allosphingosinicella sp.]
MTGRRLLPLLAVLAMLFSPLGHVAAAQARGNPDQAMSGHCEGMPMPAKHQPANGAIDCMIACAVVAPTPAPLVAAMASVRAPNAPVEMRPYVGIHPEADPPPPRFS